MPRSSHSCNDRRCSYFTTNTCNRFIDSLKIFFGATSGACSAIGDQALKYTRVAVSKSVMRRKWPWIPYHLLRSSTCRIADLPIVNTNCKL